MSEGAVWMMEVLQAVLIGVIGFRLQRRFKNRDAEVAAHEAARVRRDMLALKLTMATADLAYANAKAIQRGKPNGEIEAGIKAYEEAQARYVEFLSEQASEHLIH